MERDDAQAAALFAQACKAGVEDGCIRLGLSYEEGRGVERDDRRAASLFETACSAGALDGCYALGGCYAQGRGVAVNRERSTELIRRTCQGGYTPACLDPHEPRVRGSLGQHDVVSRSRYAVPTGGAHCDFASVI